METVFSDPAGEKLAFLREARRRGYSVVLVFIGLESAMLSAARVAERVEQGGHDVPEDKLEQRFPRTLANLREALTFVDLAILLDNSATDEPFRFVALWEAGELVESGEVKPLWASQLSSLKPSRD